MQQVAELNSLPVSESTFADLLKPLIEPGFRLALAMLHDPAAAEDAVQEASSTSTSTCRSTRWPAWPAAQSARRARAFIERSRGCGLTSTSRRHSGEPAQGFAFSF